MKTVPTAEEFLESRVFNKTKEQITIIMIEFAKFHVEAALKNAYEKAEITNKPKFKGDYNPIVDEDSILNAYPVENIK